MNTDLFALRHIGVQEKDLEKMYQIIGVNDLDQLINETIPSDILLSEKLNLPEGISENEFLNLSLIHI